MERSDRVQVARVYDPPSVDGGRRILVDRLWPRGLSKEAAALDEWCRDIAPSTELRTWYAHDPGRFADFAAKYRVELAEPTQAAVLDRLRQLSRKQPVTLLTATKALELSQAAVLADVIAEAGQQP